MTRFVVEMLFKVDDDRLSQVRPAHLRYWENLADRGVLLGGGLFADGSGGLLLCEVADDREIHRVLDSDPYVLFGLIRQLGIKEWNVVVGGAAPSTGVTPESLGLTMASPSGLTSSLVSRINNGTRIVRSVIPALARPLTAHEHRIARLMLDGKTNREIAAQFSVSARAVEVHITKMYRKLGINRRAQLAGALQA